MPGHVVRISSCPTSRAAGSRVRAACTSRRSSLTTRAKLEAGHRTSVARAIVARAATRAAIGASGREEGLRDVALAGVGHDDDDPLARWTPGARRPAAPPTARRRRRCPRAGRRACAHVHAVWIASSSETAITSSSSSRLSTGGTKPAPMPWMRCGPGAPAREHRRAARLDRHDPQLRVALAQVLADARDRAARADAGDEHVDARRRARARSPGRCVRRWASGLAGLVNWSGRNTSSSLRHRARRLDRLAHPAQRLGDLHARAVQAQQALALAAHALRQRQHQLVALRRAHERQRDARCCRSSPRRSSCGPARSCPSASAASIIATPMRSLTLPPGLNDSSLANSSHAAVGRRRALRACAAARPAACPRQALQC